MHTHHVSKNVNGGQLRAMSRMRRVRQRSVCLLVRLHVLQAETVDAQVPTDLLDHNDNIVQVERQRECTKCESEGSLGTHIRKDRSHFWPARNGSHERERRQHKAIGDGGKGCLAHVRHDHARRHERKLETAQGRAQYGVVREKGAGP